MASAGTRAVTSADAIGDATTLAPQSRQNFQRESTVSPQLSHGLMPSRLPTIDPPGTHCSPGSPTVRGVSTLPIVIGHRGASGYRPEHTRAAYELAIALGADAVEPDIVATSDGVLVIRHENEISGTTDVAKHPEFAPRRTTKVIDGEKLTGWFTEDFTWAELSTLRAVERIPKVRRANTQWDGAQGILRVVDLLDLLDSTSRTVDLVAEIKHASYFETIGLPLDELFAEVLRAANWDQDDRLTIESFELTVLLKCRARGIGGRLVFLIDAKGKPADEILANGDAALAYSEYLTARGLEALATEVDGISVNRKLVLAKDADLKTVGESPLVRAAHAAGLVVYCWTLRSEPKFLTSGNWKREFAAIMRSGVDGVFADQPDLAIQARASLVG
jgi:glycerophosphoryl diester phosphodiesterase